MMGRGCGSLTCGSRRHVMGGSLTCESRRDGVWITDVWEQMSRGGAVGH